MLRERGDRDDPINERRALGALLAFAPPPPPISVLTAKSSPGEERHRACPPTNAAPRNFGSLENLDANHAEIRLQSWHKINGHWFVAIAGQHSCLDFELRHLDDGVALPSRRLAFRIGSDLVCEVKQVRSSVSADDDVRMIAFRTVGRQRTRVLDKIVFLALPVQTVVRPVDAESVPGIED